MTTAVPEKYHASLQEAGVSVEEASRYYASFKIFDVDASDSIDSGELFSCLQVLGQAPKSKDEVKQLLKEHDKDDSGAIDFLEFAKLMAHVCKPQGAVRDDLVMSFQVFDKDHSGYLDREELHNAIYSMGNCTLTEKEFDQLVKAADTNGDGKIDYAEFTNLLMSDVTKLIESKKTKIAEKQSKGGGSGKDKDHKDHNKDKDHHGGEKKDKDHHGGEKKDKDHHGGEKDKHRKRSRSGGSRGSSHRSRSRSAGSHSSRGSHGSRKSRGSHKSRRSDKSH